MPYDQNNINNSNHPAETSGGWSRRIRPGKDRLKGAAGWRIFWGIITTISIIANIILVLMLISVVFMFAAGPGPRYIEKVVQKGPANVKIAIIDLQGIIQNQAYAEVHDQLEMARKDDSVKGVILRVNSPGGSVCDSDRIYHEILGLRKDTNEPVVGFMQSVAASGGYYCSAACDKIVAEPTTITGSIGVIMAQFVVRELLEEKLGVMPVIIKSREKKDWPSPFRKPSDEEIEYIEDKLILPAYERFVQIVADGREALTLARVKELADGSIYNAEEALNNKLIDKVGYLQEAIEQVKELAEIDKAQVVEYRKPFSLASFLNSQNKMNLTLDRNKLLELSRAERLYLWTAY